jgi:hypothetical protein
MQNLKHRQNTELPCQRCVLALLFGLHLFGAVALVDLPSELRAVHLNVNFQELLDDNLQLRCHSCKQRVLPDLWIW